MKIYTKGILFSGTLALVAAGAAAPCYGVGEDDGRSLTATQIIQTEYPGVPKTCLQFVLAACTDDGRSEIGKQCAETVMNKCAELQCLDCRTVASFVCRQQLPTHAANDPARCPIQVFVACEQSKKDYLRFFKDVAACVQAVRGHRNTEK